VFALLSLKFLNSKLWNSETEHDDVLCEASIHIISNRTLGQTLKSRSLPCRSAVSSR